MISITGNPGNTNPGNTFTVDFTLTIEQKLEMLKTLSYMLSSAVTTTEVKEVVSKKYIEVLNSIYVS